MENMAYRLSLQSAYEEMLIPYEQYFQFALTLSLKLKATIRTHIRQDSCGEPLYERQEYLNEEKLNSTIRYFLALMDQSIYGNKCKHKNKRDWAQLISFFAKEGGDGFKRLHLHAVIGNVPFDKLDAFEEIVKQNWQRCDFGNEEVRVVPISNARGWVGYMTKTVKLKSYDALDVVSAKIPRFIEISSAQKVV
jgi:hypothetical protein